MRRPDWWPGPWPWPGSEAPEAVASSTDGPRRATTTGSLPVDPSDSFLRVLVAAFGAERAVVYRRAREGDRWVPERRTPQDASSLRAPDARGHPLTWCARERLVAQIPTRDLPGAPEGATWLLAGGMPGGERVLVLAFVGAPPTAARRAMEAAVEHLSSLPPDPPSGGRTN